MRALLAATLLFAFLGLLQAQDQEKKLVDRLLRPNTELKSAEEGKKFVSDRASPTKSAHVKSLYLSKKSNSKTFSNTRDFSAKDHHSWAYNATGSSSTSLSAGRVVPTSMYRTSAVDTSRAVTDAGKTTIGNTYAGNRPYLKPGKSQKFLDRKNPPMTIDQVRELLNKNK